MSAVKAMGKSANACLLVVMSAFGIFAPYLRVLIADDGCTNYLGLLMSDVDSVALLETFRALKPTRLEGFRARKP